MNAAVLARFEVKVTPAGECLQWTGAKTTAGYGLLKVNGWPEYAHRLAYEHHVGPIPSGLVIDHLCRNRACVNPDHLEPVTNHENVLRGEPHQRRSCPRGHEKAIHMRRDRRGKPYCLACARITNAVRRAQRGATA